MHDARHHPEPSVKRLKFIGCEIVYREACYLAAVSRNRVDVTFLRKGLHDLERKDMIGRVQQEIDAVDADRYDAILLGYARCNDGLVGIRSRSVPLVIPRAHDCITFLFGSRMAYSEYHQQHPGTYFMSTGWAERNDGDSLEMPAYDREGIMGKLGLTDSYEQMVAKYGQDNADFIIETIGDWRKNYSRMLYLQMGLGDESSFIEQSRRRAEANDWQFEARKGSMALLRKLFDGPWDEDLVIVRPGQAIAARNDDRVLDAE